MRPIESTTKTGHPRGVRAALWGVLAASAAAWACDTPVFEYTMQNWQRDSYRVYCLFEDPSDAAAQAACGALANASSHGGHANLTLTRVNVSDCDGPVPPTIRRLLDQRRFQRFPAFAVLTPRGAEMHVGALDPGEVAALLDSPKRRELAQLLSDRKHGVVILLSGADAGENRRSGDAIRGVAESAAARGQDYGIVAVDRTDPGEQWLVRQLLAVEPDLAGIRSAMAFPVFGRGHFLPPYVGPGINGRNLRDLQDFLNGPCSCEIKESSLGMDLLLDWDFDRATAHWPAAAATSASPGFTIFDIAPPASNVPPDRAATTEAPPPGLDRDSLAPFAPPPDQEEPPDTDPARAHGVAEDAVWAASGSVPPRVVPPSWPEAPAGPDRDGDAWETAEEIEVDRGVVLTDTGPRQRHLGPNLAAMRGAGESSAPAVLHSSPAGFAQSAAGALAALAFGIAVAGSIMIRRARRLAAAEGSGDRGAASWS